MNPLLTEHRLRELIKQADALIEMLQEHDASVGDAMLVRYADEWARVHGIGKFGRLTMKDGVQKYHAAPAHLDRTVHFEFPERNLFAYIKDWDRGMSVAPPVDQILSEVQLPRQLTRSRSDLAMYERSLFESLSSQYDITLINPSFSAMVELKTTVGGFVMITSHADERWREDIEDFVFKTEGKLKMVSQPRGVAYLGLNEPLWYPKMVPWVRLILSPFHDMSQRFTHFRTKFHDRYVMSSYEKKPGVESISYLPRDPQGVMYNPRTVDKLIGGKGRLAFLETTVPLIAEHVEDHAILHTPWFVHQKGEWKEIAGKEWLVEGNVVYNVKAQGTFLSRRRFFPPKGYSWEELSHEGTHTVTYSTVDPQEIDGISILPRPQGSVVSFDGVKIVENVISVQAVPGTYFSLNQSKGVPLPSDENIRFCQGNPDEVDFIHAFQCATRWFSPFSHRDSAIQVFENATQGVYTPLGRGVKTRAFITDVARYVEAKNVQGRSFVFPTVRAMSTHTHLATLFFGQWHSWDVLETAVEEKDHGGLMQTQSTLNRIVASLQECKILSHNSIGLTIQQISDVVGVPPSQIHHVCRHYHKVLAWRNFGKDLTTFALLENLVLKFDGVLEDGFVGQKTWAEVVAPFFTLSRDSFVRLRSRNNHMLHFIDFLRLNGFRVFEKQEIAFYEYKVYRGFR